MPSNTHALRLAIEKKRRRKEFIPSRLKRVGRAARKWELRPVPDWGIHDCWEGAFAFKPHSNSEPLFVTFAGRQWQAEGRKFFQTVLTFKIYEAVNYQFLDELSMSFLWAFSMYSKIQWQPRSLYSGRRTPPLAILDL
jgi:hypothetical protein